MRDARGRVLPGELHPNWQGGRPVCKKCSKKLEYKSITRLCRKHYLGDKIGEKALNWKGGRKINTQGYILIYSPNHPNKDQQGYVREHRLIMEKYLKRYLKKEEIIHHINHKRNDNRIENLKIMKKEEHDKLHLVPFKKGHLPYKHG